MNTNRIFWTPNVTYIGKYSTAPATDFEIVREEDYTSSSLPPLVKLTRASTATYIGSTGDQVIADIDTPRFDYGFDNKLAGLLIEDDMKSLSPKAIGSQYLEWFVPPTSSVKLQPSEDYRAMKGCKLTGKGLLVIDEMLLYKTTYTVSAVLRVSPNTSFTLSVGDYTLIYTEGSVDGEGIYNPYIKPLSEGAIAISFNISSVSESNPILSINLFSSYLDIYYIQVEEGYAFSSYAITRAQDKLTWSSKFIGSVLYEYNSTLQGIKVSKFVDYNDEELDVRKSGLKNGWLTRITYYDRILTDKTKKTILTPVSTVSRIDDYTAMRNLPSLINLFRSTQAQYMNKNTTLTTVDAHTPRFKYTFETSTPEQKGLLLEPKRTNLILWSDTYTQWVTPLVISPESNGITYITNVAPKLLYMHGDSIELKANTSYTFSTLYKTIKAPVRIGLHTGKFQSLITVTPDNKYTTKESDITYTNISINTTGNYHTLTCTVTPKEDIKVYASLGLDPSTYIFLRYIQLEEGTEATTHIRTADKTFYRDKDKLSYNIQPATVTVLYEWVDLKGVYHKEYVDYIETSPLPHTKEFDGGYLIKTTVHNRLLTEEEKQ